MAASLALRVAGEQTRGDPTRGSHSPGGRTLGR